MSENQNRTDLRNEFDESMELCGLHYETALQVSQDGPINWLAMRLASSDLNDLRPDLQTQPDEFVEWDPLDKSIELYRKWAADPEIQADWEDICRPDEEDEDL
jgi:hypothetical protein